MNAQLKRAATSRVRQHAARAGQTRTVLAWALACALLSGVGLLHAASRVAGVRAGYELGRVEETYRQRLREHEQLTMERATLRSAPRLEAIARSRLGMAPPTASQLVSLGRSLSAGGKAPVAPAPVRRTLTLASLP